MKRDYKLNTIIIKAFLPSGSSLTALLVCWLCILSQPNVAFSKTGTDSVATNHRHLDVVFCLDLSGSTNGLIDNVRAQVWSIVNMSATAQDGCELRLGLVGFSRPSFGAQNNYVKTICKLTNDFNHFEAELWKIKPQIEKGDQFVSTALEVAGLEMNWSKSPDAVKILFLVGNGRTDTGSPDYRSVVQSIQDNGIELIPVYCLRDRQSNEIMGWEQIGRVVNRPLEKTRVMKHEPLIKPLKDEGKFTQKNRELNNLLFGFSKETRAAVSEVITCDNKAMLLDPVSYENRLVYRISDHCTRYLETFDLGSSSIQNPAELIKYDFALLDDSLQHWSVNRLYDKIEYSRKKKMEILGYLKGQLPPERQLYINSIVAKSDFETSNILERIVLRHVYLICTSKGLKFR